MPRKAGAPAPAPTNDRVEAHLAQQLRDREGLADHLVGLEVHAEVLQALDFAADDFARQAERRDAVLQHAADHVQRLVDGDVAAVAHEVGRRRQARRARADDGDLARAGCSKRGGSALRGCGVVADETLEPADRHRLELAADDALRLALRFLRADAAADRREQVGLVDDRQRAVDVAHQQVADEARNVDRDRAALDAGRLRALDAALGLGQRIGHRVAEVDFLEVARAL